MTDALTLSLRQGMVCGGGGCRRATSAARTMRTRRATRAGRPRTTTTRANASGVSRHRQLEHVTPAQPVVACKTGPPSAECVQIGLPPLVAAVDDLVGAARVADQGDGVPVGHAR